MHIDLNSLSFYFSIFIHFVSSQAAVSNPSFITWNGSNFVLNNNKFFVVGFNAPWLGIHKDPIVYPTHIQIEEAFVLAVAMNATVIRSHTMGMSSGTPNSLRPSISLGNTLNQAAWEPIDYAFLMARKYNIRIIAPMVDNYDYPNGNYANFTNPLNLPREAFWLDGNPRGNFKQYLNDWLNHINQYTNIQYKNDPYLFMVELGNELGNLRPERNIYSQPSNEWITSIATFIKSIDQNHIVLNPTDEQLGNANEFNITVVDAYSQHYYTKDYKKIDYYSNQSLLVKKPFLIGEYDSGYGLDWFKQVEQRPNVAGTLFWCMYPHINGVKGGAKIVSDDGFSLW